MRILTVTRLFPNAASPLLGTFILERVRGIAQRGHEVRLIAPVPFVPPGPVPKRHRPYREIPVRAEYDGFPVEHPRFIAIPKLRRTHGRTYAHGVEASIRRSVNTFRPDLIDVNYLFPDACGVVRVAKKLGVPVVCTARGTDVKYFGRFAAFARRIRTALNDATSVHAVSRDLANEIRRLGLFAGPVTVVRNGVDPEKFMVTDRAAARAALGLPATGPIAICVGHLVEEHRQDLLVEALATADMPRDLLMLLVGDGHLRPMLRRLATQLGVADRLRLVGPISHDEVPTWLNAADVSVLVSEREGCPNIVLESSACGIPCLLSDIPEMREVLAQGHDGTIVTPEPRMIARALRHMLDATGRQGSDTRRTPRSTILRTWDDVARDLEVHFQAMGKTADRVSRPDRTNDAPSNALLERT